MDYISQSSDPQAAVANQEAGAIQKAESTSKTGEPSYETKANGTSKAESTVKNIKLNPKTDNGKPGTKKMQDEAKPKSMKAAPKPIVN